MLTKFHETLRKCSSDIAGSFVILGITIRVQRVELFDFKGGKVVLLALFKSVNAAKTSIIGPQAQKVAKDLLGHLFADYSRNLPTAGICDQCKGMCPLDFCPPQVYATSTWADSSEKNAQCRCL